MREKILPPDHKDIDNSLYNIGQCYDQLKKFNLALEYYKQALIIYEQCLPYGYQDRLNMELEIARLIAKVADSIV